jgi:hypothetical protein
MRGGSKSFSRPRLASTLSLLLVAGCANRPAPPEARSASRLPRPKAHPKYDEVHRKAGLNSQGCGFPGAQLGTADFDGRNGDDRWCHDPANGHTWISLAEGAGSFSDTGVLTTWCGFPGAQFGTADFDGDGHTDLWCHDPTPGSSTAGGTWVARWNGNGFDDQGILYRWCGFPGAQFGTADFDGDGNADLWCHDPTSGSSTEGGTWVARWNGTGFNDTNILYRWCMGGSSFGTADFDGDGRADLWCHDSAPSPTAGGTWVARWSGSGFSDTGIRYHWSGFPGAARALHDKRIGRRVIRPRNPGRSASWSRPVSAVSSGRQWVGFSPS